jgi:parallel beta-helix repeat protein
MVKLRLRMCEFMKKQLKLLPLLVVIILGTFAFANSLFFFTVGATYVEGSITQDTTWTLVDSPFVVSQNVIVYQNATLTIESGVEISFGGHFSLIVNGQLVANGTQDKMITFTSNKHQPEAGDWNAIEFNGTEPSTLAYCSIKYAKIGTAIENGNVEIKYCEISDNLQNGITIEDGTVKIKNSLISDNHQNGIIIVNSTVEIQDNEIASNSQSGIYVTGDNQVTIQNNTIRSNADGILLTGNLISGVNLTQNIVLSNTESGIQLDADAYNNIIVLYNVLSANNKGFYVSGQASTYITNNSISYNTVGVFYEQAQGHEAHWNDFYGNDYGMDVSSTANVDATYNYWGDESGPYHTSLNPAGKGNPVGGDGVDLDFVFFLTAPIGYINERPTARLLTDKKVVPPNQFVTFIATTSSDDRQVNQYFFDFGDGKNSSWTTLSIFVHEYSSVGTYDASVTVIDDFGVTSSNLAIVTINVQNLTPLNVSLTSDSYTVDSEERVLIAVRVTDGLSAVENANITVFSIKGGSFTPSSGFTNTTGYFTATFAAPNITKQTNIRVTATASKSGYADGSDYNYLKVLPTLSVQVTVDSVSIESEAISNVNVHVASSGQSVADALVVASSDAGGTFLATTETTDSTGDVTFTYRAPQTATQLNVTITATASKSGYAGGEGEVEVTVIPISIAGAGDILASVQDMKGNPVSEATVTSISQPSEQLPLSGTTNSTGHAAFYNVKAGTYAIEVSKTGYDTRSLQISVVDGQTTRTVINLSPSSSGSFGSTLMWGLLAVVLVVVVIVTVLILKRRSHGEADFIKRRQYEEYYGMRMRALTT